MSVGVARHSFPARVAGIALLDRSMIDEIKDDSSALKQAAILVIAVPLVLRLNPWSNFDERSILVWGDSIEIYTYGGTRAWTLGIALGSVALALFVWMLSALVLRFVATRMLGSPRIGTTWAELARPLGFTSAIYLVGILTGISVVGFLVSVVLPIWTTAMEVVIMSQIFQFSKWRAFSAVIITWIVPLMLLALLLCVLVSQVGRPIDGLMRSTPPG